MTNDDDDLSSFSTSSRLRAGDRSLSRPFRVIRSIRLTRGAMVGQREINANFSGNRLYACLNRVRDRPCFSGGPIFQRSYVGASI